MRRLTALLLLLVPALATSGDFVCGPTGFNSNIASAAKSFRCAPATLTAGLGTLAVSNASTTITAAQAGAFANIVAPEAVPGADGNFFRVSGLMVLVNDETIFLNVVTKTSNTVIAAELAGTNIGILGTATKWSYWNTVCYRTAAGTNVYSATDTACSKDTRIWKTNRPIEDGAGSSQNPNTGIGIGYSQGAGSASTIALVARPASFPVNAFASTNILVSLGSLSVTAKDTVFTQITGIPYAEREYQFSMQSAAANTWGVGCYYVPKAK